MGDETVSMQKLNYWVEYSPSRSAICCKCSATIAYLELRFAVKRVRKAKIWHHFECFFTKYIPSSALEIDNIECIRFEDVQRIEHKLENIVYSDIFNVYYLMDASQVCTLCTKSIAESELYIFTILEDKEGDDCLKCCYHLHCFSSHRNELNFHGTAEMLAGFSWLDESDKDLLKVKLGNETNLNRVEKSIEHVNEVNEKFKELSDLFFGFFDKLHSIDGADRDKLLHYNNQLEPKTKIEKIELLADCMTFGALEKCPNCGSGQLIYKSGCYVCHGVFSKKRQCFFQCQKPDRIPFVIPDNLKQKYIFLTEYVYEPRQRVTRLSLLSNYLKSKQGVEAMDIADSANSIVSRSVASQTSDSTIEVVNVSLPLAGKYVCCIGLSSCTETDLKIVVENLGGQVVKNFVESVVFVVVDEYEQNKNSSLIIDAEKFKVPIVSQAIINVLKMVADGDFAAFLLNIVKCFTISSASHQSNHHLKRFIDESNNVVAKKAKDNKELAVISGFGSTQKEKQILKIDVVDPRFEFAEFTHVYKSDEHYSVVLNKFDSTCQKYTFYTMQLLETEECNYYWVFRSWGRVGTNYGDAAAKDFGSKDLAIQYFEYIYYKKTGNEWKHRKNSVKVAGKFWDIHICCNRID